MANCLSGQKAYLGKGTDLSVNQIGMSTIFSLHLCRLRITEKFMIGRHHWVSEP